MDYIDITGDKDEQTHGSFNTFNSPNNYTDNNNNNDMMHHNQNNNGHVQSQNQSHNSSHGFNDTKSSADHHLGTINLYPMSSAENYPDFNQYIPQQSKEWHSSQMPNYSQSNYQPPQANHSNDRMYQVDLYSQNHNDFYNGQQQQQQSQQIQPNQMQQQGDFYNNNQYQNDSPSNDSRYIGQIDPSDFYKNQNVSALHQLNQYSQHHLNRSFFEKVPKDTPLIAPPPKSPKHSPRGMRIHRSSPGANANNPHQRLSQEVAEFYPSHQDNSTKNDTNNQIIANHNSIDLDTHTSMNSNNNNNGMNFHNYEQQAIMENKHMNNDNFDNNPYDLSAVIDLTNGTDFDSPSIHDSQTYNENNSFNQSDSLVGDKNIQVIRVSPKVNVHSQHSESSQISTAGNERPGSLPIPVNSKRDNHNSSGINNSPSIADGSYSNSSTDESSSTLLPRIDNTRRSNYDPDVRFPINTLPSKDWPHIPPEQIGSFLNGLAATKTFVPGDSMFSKDFNLYVYKINGCQVEWDYNTGLVNATALFKATDTAFEKLQSIIDKYPEVARVTEFDPRTKSHWIPMAVAIPFITYMKKEVFSLTPIFGRSILESFDDIKMSLNEATPSIRASSGSTSSSASAPQAPTALSRKNNQIERPTINMILGPSIKKQPAVQEPPVLTTAEKITANLNKKLDSIFGAKFDTTKNHSAELGIYIFDELRGNKFTHLEVPIFIEALLKYFPESSWGLEPDYRIVAVQKITEISNNSVWSLTSQKGKAFIRIYSWLKHDYKNSNKKALTEILKIVKQANLSKHLLEHFHLLKIVRILNNKLDDAEIKKLTSAILDFKADSNPANSDSGSNKSKSVSDLSKPSNVATTVTKPRQSTSESNSSSSSSGSASVSPVKINSNSNSNTTASASTGTNSSKPAVVSLNSKPPSLSAPSTLSTSTEVVPSKNTLSSKKPNLNSTKRPLSLSSTNSSSSSSTTSTNSSGLPAAKRANIYVASTKKSGNTDADKKAGSVGSIDTSKTSSTASGSGDKRVWSFSDYVKKGSSTTDSASNENSENNDSSSSAPAAKKFSLDNYKKTNDIDNHKSSYEIPAEGGILRRRFQSAAMAKKIDNYEVREPKLITINGQKVKKFVRWDKSVDEDEERKQFRSYENHGNTYDHEYSQKNAHSVDIGEGKALHLTKTVVDDIDDDDDDANYEPSL